MTSRKITAEHKYNIVLVGPLGVGKSALTVKYITKRFIMDYDPFIEGTYSKIASVDGQDALIKIRDTYMESNWDVEKYIKWADGFLLVYSITCMESFEQARSLLEVLSQHLRSRTTEYPVVLVGNKSDLDSYRQVSEVEGHALATQFDSKFCETSAAEEYYGVEHVFLTLVHEIQRERELSVGTTVDLLPLFISEESKYALSLPQGGTAARSGGQIKRVKSGKPTEAERKRTAAADTKKPPGGFKIFNKSFKIFN